MKRKIVSWLVLVAMLMSFVVPVSSMAATTIPAQVFDVSKSKTATALDENNQSQITLSLPSAEEELKSDVVFVLDASDCFTTVVPQLIDMLNKIKQIEEVEKGNVKYSLVFFRGNAVYTELELLNEDTSFSSLEEISNSSGFWQQLLMAFYLNSLTPINSDEGFILNGSNLDAGLEAAKKILDADKEVEDSRKYVIAVSDALNCFFTGESGNTESIYAEYNDIYVADCMFYVWGYQRGETSWGGNYTIPEENFNWDTYINHAKSLVESDGDIYVSNMSEVEEVISSGYSADRFITKGNTSFAEKFPYITKDTLNDHANILDRATVECINDWESMKEKGYKLYYSVSDSDKYKENTFPYEFAKGMNKVAGYDETTTFDFDQIKEIILYAVGAGSRVVDEMGRGEDYDFDFVNDIDLIDITINDVQLDKTAIDDFTYGFGEVDENGEYPFVLTYNEEVQGQSNDGIVLDINTNVSNFERVQLIYNVELVEKSKKSGTHGQLDLDGDGIIDGSVDNDNPNGVEIDEAKAVYTNTRATLYPVNSDGMQGVEEDFPRPSVVYEVKKSGGGGGPIISDYTLTYESNGGTEYAQETYAYGTNVNLDKVPFRSGYTFTGWYADSDLTERITRVTMDSSKTVYAGWEASVVPPDLNGEDHFAYIIGYPDGTVQPMGNITRAEVAEVFFRLLQDETRDDNLTKSNPYNDVAENAWYASSVSTLTKLDIIKGMTTTEFAPNAPITRAQFAAICARFDTGKTEGISNFSDISGHWAEEEIERAVSLGWIAGYEDGTFRPDQPITRAEAMTIINRVLVRIPENADDLLDGMNEWIDNQPGTWYYLAVQEATNSHDYEMKNDINETWTELNEDPDWSRYNK